MIAPQAAIDIDPGSERDAIRANQLIEAGLWLHLGGDRAGARSLFMKALVHDPSNRRAREWLAKSEASVSVAPAPLQGVPPPAVRPMTVPPLASVAPQPALEVSVVLLDEEAVVPDEERRLITADVLSFLSEPQFAPGALQSAESAPEARRPVAPVFEAPRPVPPAPEARRPVTPAPEASRPVPPAEARRPVTPVPEARRPIAPAMETPRPVTPAPEARRPVSPAPETPRPVTPVPEARRPVTPAPEAPRPVTPVPEARRPVAPVPEAPRPATPLPVLVPRVEPLQEVATLLQGVADLLSLGDASSAIELLKKAEQLAPGDARLAAARERCMRQQQASLEARLGDLKRVPALKLRMADLMKLSLDSRAGFLLSRIDGRLSFEALFAVSGMSRLDTMRVLVQLLDQDIISVR
ncbi:hypothetical protein [Vitiosangium sp. GDMCC 1.1324]|uniref:hypothetical protein n=1 Tax=Vitiosangium sp. (strain GDMCC 1.1324) TaxID=2138576 RepID=UPI000D37533B|nr:hypothetical protein [Vitiosangium sp. GDMCC 1.1324]PTL78296.1 hypothetical protein DAT35_40305 [Vitiosangium sp. GDMCC 1.1324]